MSQVIKMTEAGKQHQIELNKKYINNIGKPCVVCKRLVTDKVIYGKFDCENCENWVNAVILNVTTLRSILRGIMLKESSDIKDVVKYVMSLKNRLEICDLLIKRGYMKRVGKTYYYIEEGVEDGN